MVEVAFEGGRLSMLHGPIIAVMCHRVERACCAVQDQERMLRESLKQEQRAAKAREKVGRHWSCLATVTVTATCRLHSGDSPAALRSVQLTGWLKN